MVRLSDTFLAIAAAAAVVNGDPVSHDWSLTAQEIAPDGFTRSSELVNGVFPGPLLAARKGDSITVDVKNNLLDPTMRRSTSIVRNIIFKFLSIDLKISIALARDCAFRLYVYKVQFLLTRDPSFSLEMHSAFFFYHSFDEMYAHSWVIKPATTALHLLPSVQLLRSANYSSDRDELTSLT